MKRLSHVLTFLLFLSPLAPSQPSHHEYAILQQRLSSGWNTWDVHSVTAEVLLPEGLAIRLGLKHTTTLTDDAFLQDALIGRQNSGAEQVFPGPHAYDGSYTELRLSWQGHNLCIQTAHDGKDLVILVTPLNPAQANLLPPALVVSAGFLWQRPGFVVRAGFRIEAHSPSGVLPIYFGGAEDGSVNVPVAGPYFAAALKKPVAVSTGKARSISEIRSILNRQRAAFDEPNGKSAQQAPVAEAIQTVLGWDTIYEPERGRVISPVSRIWSISWGGYVLFDWDTFFAASLAAIGDRDLAYADVIETLREATPQGFVGNFARAGNWKSFDRSEPPVGALTVLGLYHRFNDKWLLEETFEPLLRWNRWWNEHRQQKGYLVWGTDPENQPRNPDDDSVGTLQGAKYESGLDNSPMYDQAFYDPDSHQMQLADVGLMSLYIVDCDALAQVAQVLGKSAEKEELSERATRYRSSLKTLWDEHRGIFLNKDLHTGQLNNRLSPTNFYPLIARAATPAQADRMIREHLLNPKEFWGQWVIPSIERDDPAFADQNYWRGRIWGPMNYLVYLGLRNYHDPAVRKQFAQKSLELFLREWQQNGHVHENYNALTGSGDDVRSSDRFYHWGALLGLIEYLEETDLPKPDL